MEFLRFTGIIPLGIGLVLIGFAWSMGTQVFFSLMMTFVALAFVMQGAALLSGKLGPKNRLRSMMQDLQELQSELAPPDAARRRDNPGGQGNYACSACGAPMGNDADVSPHGDVKCGHCGRWYNIHHST